MIEFKCRHCGKFLKLPQSYAGKTTECPGCLRPVPVPGAPPPKAPTHAPRSSTPEMHLCVDCGRSVPTSQIMEHTGQFVCYDCYHARKPIVLKPRKKRKKGRKRKIALWLLLLAAVGAGLWALWACL